jgi:hypothetical protein
MNDIDQLGVVLARFIFPQLSDELIRLGHKLTGDLEQSFEVKVREKGDIVTIEFLMLKYGLSLEYGIKPEKIPYTIGGKPRGGKSKYIQGLIRFAKLKFGATKKRAKAIAFAIAHKHKKEGYTIDKSKLGFMTNVLKKDEEKIVAIVQDYFEASIDLMIEEFLTFKQAA